MVEDGKESTGCARCGSGEAAAAVDARVRMSGSSVHYLLDIGTRAGQPAWGARVFAAEHSCGALVRLWRKIQRKLYLGLITETRSRPTRETRVASCVYSSVFAFSLTVSSLCGQ